MEEKDIRKETLKPVTKVNSKLDKELQEWEVESTKGGGDLNDYTHQKLFSSLKKRTCRF
jgi:hypothetical protein